MNHIDHTRRRLLTGVAVGTALTATGCATGLTSSKFKLPDTLSAESVDLARDERYWRGVARLYERTTGILNLEHGYWGKTALPVQRAYLEALRMVNLQNSFYARKDFNSDEAAVTQNIANVLGAHEDEVVITRNATEACQNLIRQYQGLKSGHAVLLADIDYPAFKAHMHWLAQGRGVRVVEVKLPARGTQTEIREAYLNAFDANPDLRMMLITHVSNQHGLVIPVAEIATEARRRGIDVICDAAQSWGLLDYKVTDLNVDWAAFNLHKWIGAPLGTGALYMRRGSLDKIAPYPGEQDPDSSKIASRIHSGTVNFAARLAVPTALDFHRAVGPANKEARLRYLRDLWTREADNMSHLEVLGGADEASWTGIGSFRLKGKSTVADAQRLQQRMEQDFGIFSVVRNGLASGSCVRITPQVFNSADDMGKLVNALKQLG